MLIIPPKIRIPGVDRFCARAGHLREPADTHPRPRGFPAREDREARRPLPNLKEERDGRYQVEVYGVGVVNLLS